jgi:1-acyl-sn-glycerol-3-phosphate acyltransferase
MKASYLGKLIVLFKTVISTLGVSFVGLYLRFSNTYTKTFADSVLRWWAAYLLRSVRARWEVLNPHKVTLQAGRPYIIMSNHRSHYDIPLIFVSLPGSIRMLTKKELFRTPIWGRALKAAEFLSIDRHNHQQALKDMEEAKEKMQDGIVLWVAPEGTRTRTGNLLPFKKGGFVLAIQMGATIIPVGISGSEKILKPDTSDIYYDQMVRIHIGEPIDASVYTLEQRDQLMQDVNKAISELAGA